MAQRIQSVDPKSPARRAGLRAGDEILSLSGEPVIDFIDYQALMCASRVEVRYRRDGAEHTCVLRKDEYESAGITFARELLSGMRMCCNRCLFCFVDQLPPNVRPTMRVKDDDWRLSLMMGNYVTLTNVSDRELDRIIARHASPLYISVHAWDPDLRTRILGTPRAARLPDQLRRLSAGGIEFHAQAVLCPGINDGAVLEDTIARLAAIEGTLSLALVPVGLTGHRTGLYPIAPYTREQARAVIGIADRWREKFLRERGTRFVFPSDEFYLLAGEPLPEDEAYEDYAQIDDGVGLLRGLETEFDEAWRERVPRAREPVGERNVLIACGTSAAPFLREMLDRRPIPGLSVEVLPVENTFFGKSVTVSGLITGRDLTNALRGRDCDRVLITECMLRAQGDRFLDDMTLDAAQREIGRPIAPVGRHGWDLLDALLAARDEPGGM